MPINREKITKFLKQKATDLDPFSEKETQPKPFCSIPPIEDDSEWILTLYREILGREDVNRDDDGYKYWMQELVKGQKREAIEQYFRQIAQQEASKNTKIDFSDLLNKDDKGRVLVVMPESAGDVLLITSLFSSIKKRYPNYALYVSTKQEYKGILDGNPYVDNWLEYNPIMDNLLWLEGKGNHKGYFNVAYLPHIQTQRMFTYHHNGEDKIDFNIN